MNNNIGISLQPLLYLENSLDNLNPYKTIVYKMDNWKFKWIPKKSLLNEYLITKIERKVWTCTPLWEK